MKGKIFNAQEVQAIIAGNKTMFREVIKKTQIEPSSFLDRCGMELLLSECPYQVGQKIFVKESFDYREHYSIGNYDHYTAWKKRPATHMKQEHSRLTLEITNIKVERLADISEGDCKKEGIGYTGGWNGEDFDDGEFYFGKLTESEDGINWKNEMFEYPDLAFASLWNRTHKKPEEKFEANPFVWVVDFKVNK